MKELEELPIDDLNRTAKRIKAQSVQGYQRYMGNMQTRRYKQMWNKNQKLRNTEPKDVNQSKETENSRELEAIAAYKTTNTRQAL